MKPLGLLGDPVEHSLSPDIFRFIGRRCGIPVSYDKIRIAADQVDGYLRSLKMGKLVFTGLNVTLPHKQAVIRHLDEMAIEVRALGAANVIHRVGGRLIGHNTDVEGIVRSLSANLENDWNQADAVIYGAGGAGLAAAYALAKMGARSIQWVNRNFEGVKRKAQIFSHIWPETEFTPVALQDLGKIFRPVSICIQATPLGMSGFSPWPFPLPRTLSPSALAFDVVYRPTMTSFMAAAQKMGFRILGGLDMLIWQALAAWEIWLGPIEERDLLKTELQEFLVSLLGPSHVKISVAGAPTSEALSETGLI